MSVIGFDPHAVLATLRAEGAAAVTPPAPAKAAKPANRGPAPCPSVAGLARLAGIGERADDADALAERAAIIADGSGWHGDAADAFAVLDAMPPVAGLTEAAWQAVRDAYAGELDRTLG